MLADGTVDRIYREYIGISYREIVESTGASNHESQASEEAGW